ncbi:MAG: HAD hydrolase-like protein [Candidatus Pacebacteria bacterium]|nr:HAD hydrolase-like protein [Candidatus Paceibacterota bacterium]
MKTILVDAINTFVDKENGVFQEMYELLESYPNKKIIVTNADDNQIKKFGLDTIPYELFTMKHEPNKPNPKYFETLLKKYHLDSDGVIYFEHNRDATETARSLGITTYYYDPIQKDLNSLELFLNKNL